jgi:hypothetical protein
VTVKTPAWQIHDEVHGQKMDIFRVLCPLLQLYTNLSGHAGKSGTILLKIYGFRTDTGLVKSCNNCRVLSAIAATAASNTALFALEGVR